MDESNRVGLMVARLQPLHRGHTHIISLMIENYRTVILGLGSTQKSLEAHDPWTVETRMQMVRNVYGERIKIVPLKDLGLVEVTSEWVDYVLDKVNKLGLPEPTDYWSGSHSDAVWYKSHFSNAPAERDPRYFAKNGLVRRLHILDRSKNIYPAATELRTFLETRDDGWKEWVPAVNHKLVEETYPEAFKVKYKE
jgi:hypothetical protein